jgi:formylglycine-generating enzyme required for sulfatase activity
MVKLPQSYCIDSTEVTRAQYSAWLASSPTTIGQETECSWNMDYTPACDWPAGTLGDHPVVCVDWCDAHAYCKSVGKRLCGNVAGGPNGFADFADAAKSQWVNACLSGAANNAYPYGSTYDAQKCNGLDKDIADTIPAGSLTGCTSAASGYAGVFDLSGNVGEWEDSCEHSTGSDDNCRIRGGSYYSLDFDLRCANDLVGIRSFTNALVGFRCCSL